MEGWKECKFNDFLENGQLSYGIVQPGAHESTNFVPILRATNIKNGRINFDNIIHVASQIEEKYARTRLNGGELLITVVGNVGECAIAQDNVKGWNVARAICVARIKENFDKKFVLCLLKTEDAKFQIYGNTNDTVQPTLNLTQLKELIFFVPNIKKQQAIAAVLSSLDDKIDLLHRQNKTLEALAQTLFRQWFVEEADTDGEASLSDFAQHIRENVTADNLNMFNNYVGLEHIEKKQMALYQCGNPEDIASNKSKFLENDILFGKLRPYFHKVTFAPFDGICSTDILVIRPIKEELFAFCLCLAFSDDFVQHSDIGSEGTRMPRTNWNILSSYKIAKPALQRVRDFNVLVMPSIAKMTKNISQIHTLTRLRDTLLPKLMSGEIRVEV